MPSAYVLLAPLVGLALLLPRPAWALAVTEAVCTVQADNALRFDCVIETDAAARVNLRFCDTTVDGPACAKSRQSEVALATASTSCSSGSSCWKADVTVTNMISGHAYAWEAVASTPVERATYRPTGALAFLRPGPLPSPDLAGIDLAITTANPATHDLSYVAFNYGCSDASVFPPSAEQADYLVIADADGNIVWYQDPRPDTGRAFGQILAFQVLQADGRVLLIDNFQTVLEYSLAGDTLAQLEVTDDDFLGGDGVSRYPHHEIWRTGDTTWMLVAGVYEYADINDCDGDGRTTDINRYSMDGVYAFDADWTLSDESTWSLTDAYRPQDCEGPQPPTCMPAIGGAAVGACDWFHTNSLHVGSAGKWLLSSRTQHKLVQVDILTGAVDWELHGDNEATGGGDWTVDADRSVAAAHFSGQHHARVVERGRIQLFDNHTEDDDHNPRGLELALDSRTRTFHVARAWDMTVTDDDCLTAGSIFPVGGDHVLVTCGSGSTIREYDGTGTQVWELSLGCTDGEGIGQTYRAQPVELAP